MTITRTAPATPDEPTRSKLAFFAVVGILLAGMGMALAYFLLLRPASSSPYSVDVSVTAPESGNRVVPSRTECPSGGRATGPITGAFQSANDQLERATYGPGQIVVFQFLVTASNAAEPDTTPEFVAAWDRSRAGGSGFDATIGIYCAFVDPSDPSSIEATDAAPMTVSWRELPPDNSDIRGKFSVAGMTAGDQAIVEVWMVLTDNGSTDPISAEVRLESSDEPFRATPERDALDLRIEFFDLLEAVQMTMTMTDPDIVDGVDVNRRERVVYELTVTNESDTNVANNVRLSDSVDDDTSVVSVSQIDDEGAETSCDVDDDKAGFTCDLRFLNPAETVQIIAEVAVALDAEVRWVKEDGDCEDDLQDICNRAIIQWSKSPTIVGELQLAEPSNIPNASILSVAKLSPYSVAYPGEEVPFEYAVTTAATSQLSDVTVTDSGCTPIDFDRGDTDNDLRLDPNEQWFFTCTIKAVSAQDETTEVTVAALDANGAPVTRTEIVELRLIEPGITVGPAPANETDPTERRFQVRISGNDPLGEIDFEVSNCTDLALQGGDADNNGTLDEGEAWVYACIKQNPAASITARVYGTDSRGAAVTARIVDGG